MQTSEIILSSAEAVLGLQRTDGSFPPGHNGPYYDPETPVRNTAHWLITLCKAYDLTGKGRFKDAVWRAAQYLISPAARPMGATFFCRKNPEKDFCNGLIGQAWTIEALATAAEKLENQDYWKLAKEVFLLHPFVERVGLWRRVNVDGSYGTFDMTFNHQLWFAAAGSLLDNNVDGPIAQRLIRFLDRVQATHLRIAHSGRVVHSIAKFTLGIVGFTKFAILSGGLINVLREYSKMVHKEIGYHAFNSYAFSMLRQCFPTHPLWKSSKFVSLLHFINNPLFIETLENNEFAYPYNPSGFEVAFTMQVFSPYFSSALRPAEWWVKRQLQLCYNPDDKMMNKATEDKETLAARLYEVTRLQDIEIQMSR